MSESLRKGYTSTLTPTRDQERALEHIVWRPRVLYTTALEQRITVYRQRGVSLSRYQQEAELQDLRAELPDSAAMHRHVFSHVVHDVLARLDTTYQAFFRRIQAGQPPGCPRFQGRTRSHSFTYTAYGNGARLDTGSRVLSKIGRIAIRWSRPPAGTPKPVTISQEADGWSVALSCADVPAQPLPPTGCETGIDVGLKVFRITSEGDAVETPRHHRTAEQQVKKAQRRVSRRKKGSKRRRKAVARLQRTHQHVQRQRCDFHHKTALSLLRDYDTISLDDVQVRTLVRNHPLATSISAAGWGQFRTIRDATAVYAGRHVSAVAPAYTTHECSGCGERIAKSLRVRTHVCTSCGLVLDRDEHAASNSHWAGQARRGLAAVVAGTNRASIGL